MLDLLTKKALLVQKGVSKVEVRASRTNSSLDVNAKTPYGSLFYGKYRYEN